MWTSIAILAASIAVLLLVLNRIGSRGEELSRAELDAEEAAAIGTKDVR